MGMFDDIVCKYKLPLPEDPKGFTGSTNFQTKDLDCALKRYEIHEDGSLHVQQQEGEYVPPDKKAKGLVGRIGYYKVTKTWLEPLKITNTIRINDYQTPNDTDYDYWVSYDIVFIDGQIKDVKLVEFEATPNEKRKKSDEEHNLEMDRWYKLSQTKRYRYLYRPYNIVIRKIFNGITKCLTKLKLLANSLERKLRI